MGTKKFGGGSVKSFEDFYGNQQQLDTSDLRNFVRSSTDRPLFHYGARCVSGGATLKTVVFQLRAMSDELETEIKEKRVVNRVFYNLEIQELEGKK